MGVAINHWISSLTSPLSVALMLQAVGFLLVWKWRRVGLAVIGLGFGWLYCMSSSGMYTYLSLGLEREFPPMRVEDLPQADAIVVLGGGVGANTNLLYYSELYTGSDRVAHAARIWKAGKAPVVIPSGVNEENAARPFLMELGVPESAILVENKAGNTEENARFVAAYVKARHKGEAMPKVLLVTSSWHMRRSLLMFRKYAPGVEVVPAAIDYESTIWTDRFSLGWDSLSPGAERLFRNTYMVKEIIGYWGYRLLR